MADRYQSRAAYPADDGASHASQPARQSAEGDPLAELARLIGQADPFNNFGRDGRQAPPRDFGHHADDRDAGDRDHAPSASGPPAWMQRMQRQQAAESHEAPRETYADDQIYRQSPPFAATEPQHDPSRYDNVLFGEADQGYAQHPDHAHQQAPNFADDSFGYQQDGYGAEGEAEPEQKPRRGGLLTVVAVIALGIVGTVGAYAYRSFVSSPRSGEPPVIKADTGPTKIVPPTNQSADGSKLIYDRIGPGGATPERVVSREEQPLDVNSKSGARVVLPQLNQNSPAGAPVAAGTRVAAAPPAGATQGDEPRRVRTLSIRPDQAEPAPAPPPAKPAPRVASPPPSANANASTNAPVSLTPPSQQQVAPVRTASTAPSGGTGNYVVQVSSQRSEADAQASYRALQGKYPSVLGSRNAAIRRADLGDKGVYYRAMVGPFSSSEDATRLCDSLKAAGGQCNIMRN